MVARHRRGVAVIGIVAIGRNEGERLVRCLGSLPRDGVTTVYVDSGSSDGSRDVAAAAGAMVVELDLSVPFTAARARNEGLAVLRESAKDIGYVQFIDGDCELDMDWIATARVFLEANPRVAVVCGRRRERFPEASVFNTMCDVEWNTPVGEAAACGGDALMRFAPLDEAGGYDSGLVAGEEPELCARLRARGWQIWRIDAPMTLHDAAMTRFRQWWLRSVRSGFGYAQVWTTMRGRVEQLYATELRRALLWGAAMPLVILPAALLYWPAAFALALVYPLQIARIALRRGGAASDWTYATYMTVAKFAETAGVVRFALERAAGRRNAPLSYK